MKTFRIEDMVRGWFVGGFEPTAWHTMDFEVGYMVHPKDSPNDDHYHTHVTEINLIVTGRMSMRDMELTAGDIFITEPWEITNSVFHEDTAIVCVKVPSMNDKKRLKLIDP